MLTPHEQVGPVPLGLAGRVPGGVDSRSAAPATPAAIPTRAAFPTPGVIPAPAAIPAPAVAA